MEEPRVDVKEEPPEEEAGLAQALLHEVILHPPPCNPLLLILSS
jgi:hypothetical protein